MVLVFVTHAVSNEANTDTEINLLHAAVNPANMVRGLSRFRAPAMPVVPVGAGDIHPS